MDKRMLKQQKATIAAALVGMALCAPSLAQPLPPLMPEPMFPALRGPMGLPPAFGAELQLSDAQQDQIFKIMHASALEMHESMTAARRAREELESAARNETFDKARVTELADAEARAIANLSLIRAETTYRIRQVLTAEQRAAADRRRIATGSGFLGPHKGPVLHR